VFIVVDLFVAVILNNLETVKSEQAAEDASRTAKAAAAEPDDLLRRVAALRSELAEFEARLRSDEGPPSRGDRAAGEPQEQPRV
jgi:hypothetical protein